MSDASPRRFRVALSFPGEHRARVEAIANQLAIRLGRDHVLYDRWHSAEFARPNLDVYLPKLYFNESDLIVIFLCEDYEKKPWCGLESRAWRTVLMNKEDDRIMFLRLDAGEVSGVFPIDGYLPIKDLSDTEVAAAILSRVGQASRPAASLATQHRVFTRKLPAVDPTLIGRSTELDRIEAAWSNPNVNFLQIVAPGGTGKTALMDKWFRRHVHDATIFGWSFYSQGTRENREPSSDDFFNELLRWFDLKVDPTDSVFRKVDLLVDRLRRERVLLILDGLEPMQHPNGGEVRDPSLRALIQELTTLNPGLVLVTTRNRLPDIADDTPIDLDNLSPADGALYLKHLGVQGEDDELRDASDSYDNHALALTLLGTYLRTFCQSDIRRRTDIKDKDLETDLTKPGRHARKVMASYARMYEGRPELDILRALGYFDRPAEPEALKLVLPEMKPMVYQAALTTLRDARLISTNDPAQPIDCHPLIREHFAQYATEGGHSRLYEHYQSQAPDRPNELDEMTPLFHAIYHGCQAGRHTECARNIYNERILRREENHLNWKLGANATDLSLLANFFKARWSQPVDDLSPEDQAWLRNDAGFALRSVGRLADAVGLLRAAGEGAEKLGEWAHAARGYYNLSEVYLVLGENLKAVDAARKSVNCANRSVDALLKSLTRTTLAVGLHYSGDPAEPLRLFKEAELIYNKHERVTSALHAFPSFHYCEVLLDQGQAAEARRRALQTVSEAERLGHLLDKGLGRLSLSRVCPVSSPESAQYLDQAVDYVRRAGRLDQLPLALLARGRPADLEEAYRIASRCGMGLYLKHPRLANYKKATA
jgi:tetratricopeptide (TPR) repeat protein